MLTSACSTFVAYHSHNGKQTEKQPRWSILTPVKCALRILDPRSTLRRVYTTPRGVTPAFVLDRYPIVVVSKVQKQSVSNAFQYVVLHPAALHTSVYFIAIMGRCNCKDTKSLGIKTLLGEKTTENLQIIG